jgi:ABC-type sugar transport system ATPase subunit
VSKPVLGVRPEDLHANVPGDLEITGRVSSVQYEGNGSLVRVTLGDNTHIVARLQKTKTVTLDAEIQFGAQRATVHLFDEADGLCRSELLRSNPFEDPGATETDKPAGRLVEL